MQVYKMPVDPNAYDQSQAYYKFSATFDRIWISTEGSYKNEIISTLENCLNAESQGYHHLEHIQ